MTTTHVAQRHIITILYILCSIILLAQLVTLTTFNGLTLVCILYIMCTTWSVCGWLHEWLEDQPVRQ